MCRRPHDGPPTATWPWGLGLLRLALGLQRSTASLFGATFFGAALFGALLSGALLGCTQLFEEDSQLALKAGLEAAEEAGRLHALGDDDLPDRAALLAVLRRPLTAAASGPRARLAGGQVLGDVEWTLTGRYALTAEAPLIQIVETRAVRLTAAGDFAVEVTLDARSDDLPPRVDGRRCRRAGARFYVGGHHGPMTQALADADEDLRCLDDALEPVRSLIELAGPGVKPTVERVATVLDREALVVQLTAPPRPDAPTEVPRAWTETGAERPESTAIFGPRRALLVEHGVLRHWAGTLTLDAATGQPLEGQIDARFAVRKGDRDAELSVSLTVSIKANADPITAPESARVQRERQRIFADREALLGPVEGASPVTLPAPGDAPRLRLGADGQLELDDGSADPAPPAAGAEEDRPPARPTPMPTERRAYDEDRPE